MELQKLNFETSRFEYVVDHAPKDFSQLPYEKAFQVNLPSEEWDIDLFEFNVVCYVYDAKAEFWGGPITWNENRPAIAVRAKDGSHMFYYAALPNNLYSVNYSEGGKYPKIFDMDYFLHGVSSFEHMQFHEEGAPPPINPDWADFSPAYEMHGTCVQPDSREGMWRAKIFKAHNGHHIFLSVSNTGDNDAFFQEVERAYLKLQQ